MKADLETRRMQMPAEQSPRSSVPVRVLGVVAVGAVLYVAPGAFIPIALAILFALILTTPVEALHRRGVPRRAAERVEAPKASASLAAPQGVPEAQPPETGIAVVVLSRTRTAVVSMVTTTILALFLLAGGPPMLARL